jgi:hypothetical protein
MATRNAAFEPFNPQNVLVSSTKWANLLNTFLKFTDEGLDISANTGDIGTITTALLQGAALTIDLNATGTDPVLSHSAFTLRADGTLLLGGDAVIQGAALTIDLDATGANPVLSHAAFELHGNGDAVFSGTLDAPSGTFGTLTAGILSGDSVWMSLTDGNDPGGLGRVFIHNGFTLYENGDAVFSGTLDAPSGTFGTLTAGILSGDSVWMSLTDGNDPGGLGRVFIHNGFTLYENGDAVFSGKLAAASVETDSGIIGNYGMTIGTQQGASIEFQFAPGTGETRIGVYAGVVALNGTTDAVVGAANVLITATSRLWIGSLDHNLVSLGANDSGGAGKRLMLYPNA